MFRNITNFDIQQPITTYAPYTARKIVTRLEQMQGIEQSFNITINYRDELTNDPFSETYAITDFPYSVAFTTNHTGNIILDSIESDYTGSGTCNAAMFEYEYLSSEDTYFDKIKNTLYVNDNIYYGVYYMPYTKTPYEVFLRYYSGSTGDIIKFTIEGIKITGERITEICYLRDTDDYIRLTNQFFVITNIQNEKLSGAVTSGALEIRTVVDIYSGSVSTIGNPEIVPNIGVNMNTGYQLSKPNSQILFLGVYGNDNATTELISYTGFYNNGNSSTTDNITILPASGNSQIKLLLSPDIEFLDHFYMNSYTGTQGNFQWGLIDMPELAPTNNSPYVYAGILNNRYTVGGNYSIDLEQGGQEAFKDPDSDPLTYSVVSENNYNDTSFINIFGRYIQIQPTNNQAGRNFNFTIRATDTGGLYAETTFNVDVTGGSQPQADRLIVDIVNGKGAFILEETATHFKAVGWYELATLSIKTIVEPTIELTGANVTMSKDYITKHSGEFTIQNLN